MEQLKPCPFCGGEAELYISPRENSDTTHMYKIICKNIGDCGAEMVEAISFYQKDYFEAKQRLIRRWNRRTEVARMEYDREEIHENCTVHVLYNSETGESSIGWWRNDKPPEVMGGENDENGV